MSALSLLAAQAVAGGSVAAPPPPAMIYTGEVPSNVAGCPYIEWRIARHQDGAVTGIFYYSDMTGISSVTGTMDDAGHFQLTLKSRTGEGPVATVLGTRSANGDVDAKMVGDGCANAQLLFQPMANWRLYNPPGQNGGQSNVPAPTYTPPSP